MCSQVKNDPQTGFYCTKLTRCMLLKGKTIIWLMIYGSLTKSRKFEIFAGGFLVTIIFRHRCQSGPDFLEMNTDADLSFIAVWQQMSPVKRICVFEHSVMTNFNCACPAIQRGQGSGFLSEGSSWLTACMSEQQRFWRDCADAQARLILRCSHRR